MIPASPNSFEMENARQRRCSNYTHPRPLYYSPSTCPLHYPYTLPCPFYYPYNPPSPFVSSTGCLQDLSHSSLAPFSIFWLTILGLYEIPQNLKYSCTLNISLNIATYSHLYKQEQYDVKSPPTPPPPSPLTRILRHKDCAPADLRSQVFDVERPSVRFDVQGWERGVIPATWWGWGVLWNM